ncbi:hypothetical protein [Rhodobacter ferrooxidans]|uniref:Uncharacterized protein n=1 Tax=Rhodobacter ferrooxidans TaxID=371731 RepID=C8RX20_9RHOB|nr:hypothetical protein [Rhodobacter sp. SW2]EEW26545.1 hypothetical protein Rsw2DRAFT_0348 [Rhodobacter sp. SW2]
MHKLSPADELAEIRAEISRLKAREAVLRTIFLNSPDEALIGRWSRIEVGTTRARVFDAKLLPQEIRDDPRYWRERVTQTVFCRPLAPAPTPRPGWPIRRELPGVPLH